MLKQIVIGSGFAFAAAVQPGPLQAYLLSRVASSGWRRTLPAAFAPLLSDGPIAALALLVLGQLSPMMQGVLRGAGGILLLYLAGKTFQGWRHPNAVAPEPKAQIPRTLLEATLVNLLNPNPYLGWALVLGPVVMAAWRASPGAGVAVVAAFYATMVAMLAVMIVAFGGVGLLGARFQRTLLLISSVVLAGIGIYQIVSGLPLLGPV